MTQALSIGASSLNADMTAIDALAQNIANAQTPGYINESANLAAVRGGATLGTGSGVEVTSIIQATNALLSANNWQAQGALSNLSALQQTLSAVENVFPLTGQPAGATTPAASNSSIGGQLSTFWSAWDAIAQNPSSQAPRVEVLNYAQSVVTSLHEASTQLSQITQNGVAELTGQVQQVNTLLGQVASLNHAIALTAGSGSSTAPLEDQLNAALGTLAQLAGVEVRMEANGTATVSIGGMAVVQQNSAGSLQLASSTTPTSGARKLSVQLQVPSGTGLAVPVSSGSISGLLSAVNTSVPKAQAMLNSVAASLATAVNAELKSAYTASGTPASSTPAHWQMFTGSPTAAGIQVNAAMVATPALIAVSSTNATTGRAAANNGAVAQAMAELGITPHGPDAKYQTLVQSMGALTQGVNNQLQAQTSVATQAQQALQAVSGVDITSELTSLLNFQQNYQASAKVLSTVDSTVQALLQAV